MILIQGWLPVVAAIASKFRGCCLTSYKKLLNHDRACQASQPLLQQSTGLTNDDFGWLYYEFSLVIIKAANARFKDWVSALGWCEDFWCQFPNPNCCKADHQLPSCSLGGERMNLTTAQLEELQELIHAAVEQAARALEHLINLDVYIETSTIQVLMPLDIGHELTLQVSRVQISVVSVNFSGLLHGTAHFILPIEGTARLLSIINREKIYPEGLNILRISTFLEIASVLINYILETVIDQIHQPLQASMPTYRQTSAENLLPLADLVSNSMVLLAQTQLEVESLQFVGDLLLVFRGDSFDTFLSKAPI